VATGVSTLFLATLAVLAMAAIATPQDHSSSPSAARRRRLLQAVSGSSNSQYVEIETSGSKLWVQNRQALKPSAQQTAKRAFKLAFYDALDASRTPEEKDYILNKLMPATASELSKSMRVRQYACSRAVSPCFASLYTIRFRGTVGAKARRLHLTRRRSLA
jgi:hypothetical protein